jgi:FAD/FMN-containing dehydrogenase
MIDELRDLVGADAVVTDPDRIASHVTDWTGRFSGSSRAVVFPGDAQQVVAIVDWCRQHRVAIVPQGGNTGMVGGSVPLHGELVVNLAKLDAIEVDADAGVVIADAGATLAAVQHAADDAGWIYPIDLGARDTATIGGTVATNAGGVHVIRYGDTRRQMLGIEAVTGAGEIVGDLRGLQKDNTGYHLPSLLAGSEGTLAIITKVCLRLSPKPAETAVALIAVESAEKAFASVGAIRRAVVDLQGLELFFDSGLELVCETFDIARPFPRTHAAYLLVEAAGRTGVMERLGEDLETLAPSFSDVAVATSAAHQAALWRYREAHTEAINLVGVPHKLDVTIPLRRMAETVTDVQAAVAQTAPDATLWIFGHAGDGTLHLNITGLGSDDHDVDDLVLHIVAAAGGSISAEHGVGRAKAPLLHLNRTPAERNLAARIKATFDPQGILNPGVILVL